MDTTWTLSLPERGTIVMHQVEDVAPLFAVIGDMAANGESTRTFAPGEFVVTSTVAGTGIIPEESGTGEFADIEGTFTEMSEVFSVSPAFLGGTGTLELIGTLTLTLDD